MLKVGRILVTGCRGQLGREFMLRLGKDFDVVGVSRAEMDITDAGQTEQTMESVRPQIVLHTAAMTNVDECERQPEMATAVNARGTANVAEACRRLGSHLLYFSTDYVFDGRKGIPYVESDAVNPLSVYGMSKLEGERLVMERLETATILRISWAYGNGRQQFVRAIIAAAREQMLMAVNSPTTPLRIVNDQFSSPTCTVDIVRQTVAIIERGELSGVVHMAAEGGCSRFRMAQEIFDALDLTVNCSPCTMDEFPQVASRPRYSVLDNRRLRDAGLNVMRPWRSSLREYVNEHRGELLS